MTPEEVEASVLAIAGRARDDLEYRGAVMSTLLGFAGAVAAHSDKITREELAGIATARIREAVKIAYEEARTKG